jgi:phosphopantetheinyl transferase (holo-ACP synthase)
MAQLAGYWVMEQPDNCLAMPVGVDRIRFFAADPAPGEAPECRVRIDRIDAQDCFSSHVLHDAAGRVRIVFDGWHTRRYGMDKAFWSASRLLSRHEVSRSVPPDVAVFEDRYDTALMRDYISRRYLTQSEREVYDSLAPKRRRQWLSGRVAAKDAVRIWLRQRRGVSGVFPQEICVIDEAADAIRLRGNVTDVVPASLRVSIAEQDGLAAAVVGEVAVGIDIQRIHAGDAGAAGFPLSPFERALLAGGDAAADATVDTASDHTRARVAKAAAAKAAGTDIGTRSGSGLQQLVLEARDGDCFRVNGRWIVTHRFQDYILGWTLQLPAVRDALSPAFTNRG